MGILSAALLILISFVGVQPSPLSQSQYDSLERMVEIVSDRITELTPAIVSLTVERDQSRDKFETASRRLTDRLQALFPEAAAAALMLEPDQRSLPDHLVILKYLDLPELRAYCASEFAAFYFDDRRRSRKLDELVEHRQKHLDLIDLVRDYGNNKQAASQSDLGSVSDV